MRSIVSLRNMKSNLNLITLNRSNRHVSNWIFTYISHVKELSRSYMLQFENWDCFFLLTFNVIFPTGKIIEALLALYPSQTWDFVLQQKRKLAKLFDDTPNVFVTYLSTLLISPNCSIHPYSLDSWPCISYPQNVSLYIRNYFFPSLIVHGVLLVN